MVVEGPGGLRLARKFSGKLIFKGTFSKGTVTAGASRDRVPQIGAFIGRVKGGTIDDGYFDADTSGLRHPCGTACRDVEGLSDAELKSGLPAGFDPAVWGSSASVNNGYPYLLANPPQ